MSGLTKAERRHILDQAGKPVQADPVLADAQAVAISNACNGHRQVEPEEGRMVAAHLVALAEAVRVLRRRVDNQRHMLHRLEVVRRREKEQREVRR